MHFLETVPIYFKWIQIKFNPSTANVFDRKMEIMQFSFYRTGSREKL